MEDATLGKVTNDHLHIHEQVSRDKAELEQIGDALILLGNNMKKHHPDIRIGEAKVTLKSDQNEEIIVLLSQLDIVSIIQKVEKLNEATDQEKRLTAQLREAGRDYIVDGLENRRPPAPDILSEYRKAIRGVSSDLPISRAPPSLRVVDEAQAPDVQFCNFPPDTLSHAHRVPGQPGPAGIDERQKLSVIHQAGSPN